MHSMNAAAKMAEILWVSLDWLVGQTDLELDKGVMGRIEEVTKIKVKENVFAMLDAFIATTQMHKFLTKKIKKYEPSNYSGWKR